MMEIEPKDESKSPLSNVASIKKILETSSNLTDKDLSELNPMLVELIKEVKNRKWLFSALLSELLPVAQSLESKCKSMSEVLTKSNNSAETSKEEKPSPEVEQTLKNFAEFKKNVEELNNYLGKFKQSNVNFRLDKLAEQKKSKKNKKSDTETTAEETIQLGDLSIIPFDVVKIIIDFAIDPKSRLNISLACKTFNKIVKESPLTDFNPKNENEFSILNIIKKLTLSMLRDINPAETTNKTEFPIVVSGALTDQQLKEALQSFDDKNVSSVIEEFSAIKTGNLNKATNKSLKKAIVYLVGLVFCVIILAVAAAASSPLFPKTTLSDAQINIVLLVSIGIIFLCAGSCMTYWLCHAISEKRWKSNSEKISLEYSQLLVEGNIELSSNKTAETDKLPTWWNDKESARLLTSSVAFYPEKNVSDLQQKEHLNSINEDVIVEITGPEGKKEVEDNDFILKPQG